VPVSSSSEPPAAVLPVDADITLGPIRAAPLLPGEERKQLVFSATIDYGGSSAPDTLTVVDMPQGVARVAYGWSGGPLRWRLAGRRVAGASSYWTPADSNCCPSRHYRFTVGASGGELATLTDQRPYLGVRVRQESPAEVSGPLTVDLVEDSDPAAGLLREGDRLLDVLNARPPKQGALTDPAAAASVYNKLSSLNAGDTARIELERAGSRIVVAVKLGSLADAFGIPIPEGEFALGAL
jgi:hypothetical protein